MPNCHKVLIVDDHPLIQSSLCSLFSHHEEFEVVGGLDRCGNVLAFVQAQPVDIILLDLNMPDVRGINILADVVGLHDSHVIILTGENQYNEIEYALELGACGVVSKADAPGEIIAACKAAILGDVYVSSGMQDGLTGFNLAAVSLSPRQRSILQYLSQGQSDKDISYRMSLAQTTVVFHIDELRRSLGVASILQIVNRAQELKLI